MSENTDTSGTERPSECGSCEKSLVSFSDEKLEDGRCPYCLDPITDDESASETER